MYRNRDKTTIQGAKVKRFFQLFAKCSILFNKNVHFYIRTYSFA